MPVLSSIWPCEKIKRLFVQASLGPAVFFGTHRQNVPDWGRVFHLSVTGVMAVLIWVPSSTSLPGPRWLCGLGEPTWPLWPVWPEAPILADERENAFFTGWYLEETGPCL